MSLVIVYGIALSLFYSSRKHVLNSDREDWIGVNNRITFGYRMLLLTSLFILRLVVSNITDFICLSALYTYLTICTYTDLKTKNIYNIFTLYVAILGIIYLCVSYGSVWVSKDFKTMLIMIIPALMYIVFIFVIYWLGAFASGDLDIYLVIGLYLFAFLGNGALMPLAYGVVLSSITAFILNIWGIIKGYLKKDAEKDFGIAYAPYIFIITQIIVVLASKKLI